MHDIVETSAFRRDVKRTKKRNKDLKKLRDVVFKLASGENLPHKNKQHPLTGNWKPKWECHIEPDWLLIYEIIGEELRLARTGSHADLFKM
jgi:mRNA interferase YafQ